jgi:hypothetical protein
MVLTWKASWLKTWWWITIILNIKNSYLVTIQVVLKRKIILVLKVRLFNRFKHLNSENIATVCSLEATDLAKQFLINLIRTTYLTCQVHQTDLTICNTILWLTIQRPTKFISLSLIRSIWLSTTLTLRKSPKNFCKLTSTSLLGSAPFRLQMAGFSSLGEQRTHLTLQIMLLNIEILNYISCQIW